MMKNKREVTKGITRVYVSYEHLLPVPESERQSNIQYKGLISLHVAKTWELIRDILCNIVCRNDTVKFECNTPKTKVFLFFGFYGLHPLVCLNSE
jgi:hypothetical protein